MPVDTSQEERSRPSPHSLGVAFWLYALHLWALFGLALSNAFLALGLLLSPRTVEWRRISRHQKTVLLPLGVYAAFLMTSILTSLDRSVSVRALGELFTFGGFLLALAAVRGEHAVRRIVDGLVIVATLLSLLALAQNLVGYGGIDERIRGPFSHYMTLAGYLLLIDVLLVAQLLCRPRLRTLWRWIALVAINVALLGTLTRNAWIGLGVAVTAMFLLRAPRLLLAYVPAALVLIAVAPVTWIHRATSILDLREVSNYDRICMVEAGAHMVRERPLFGIGPEMVEERYPIYKHPTALRPRTPHLHNTWMQVAAEQGLLGVLALAWLIGSGVWTGLRGFRSDRDGPHADLYLGAAGALLAFASAGIFEHNWGDTEVQRVALFALALPYCLGIPDE